jgi:hypothetical protein
MSGNVFLVAFTIANQFHVQTFKSAASCVKKHDRVLVLVYNSKTTNNRRITIWEEAEEGEHPHHHQTTAQ